MTFDPGMDTKVFFFRGPGTEGRDSGPELFVASGGVFLGSGAGPSIFPVFDAFNGVDYSGRKGRLLGGVIASFTTA